MGPFDLLAKALADADQAESNKLIRWCLEQRPAQYQLMFRAANNDAQLNSRHQTLHQISQRKATAISGSRYRQVC